MRDISLRDAMAENLGIFYGLFFLFSFFTWFYESCNVMLCYVLRKEMIEFILLDVLHILQDSSGRSLCARDYETIFEKWLQKICKIQIEFIDLDTSSPSVERQQYFH